MKTPFVLQYEISHIDVTGLQDDQKTITWSRDLDTKTRRDKAMHLMFGAKAIIIRNATCPDPKRNFVAKIAINRVENVFAAFRASNIVSNIAKQAGKMAGMNLGAEINAPKLDEIMDKFAEYLDCVCHAYESSKPRQFQVKMLWNRAVRAYLAYRLSRSGRK